MIERKPHTAQKVTSLLLFDFINLWELDRAGQGQSAPMGQATEYHAGVIGLEHDVRALRGRLHSIIQQDC